MLRPDLTDVIRAAVDQRLAAVHVSIPAAVVSYDATRQTATVRPKIKRLVPTSVEGEYRAENLPDLPDVKVVWPAGGSSYLVLTLAAGDPVELVCSDTDPATYRETGETAEPADVRRHSLAHCWAVPGGGSLGDVLPTGPKLVLGSEADAAALASELDRLIKTLRQWVPVANDGGAALKALIAANFSVYGSSASSSARSTSGSARIKVDS